MCDCVSSSIKIYSFKCESMSVCAHVSVQEDLNVMLYFLDIYNIDKSSIYAIKSPE